ncbi:hypothetical protein OQA88_5066 [Cercophora sp. LCS_1]
MRSVVAVVVVAALMAAPVLGRGKTPAHPFDASTATDCNWWFDNEMDVVSCKDVPPTVGITPEEFFALTSTAAGINPRVPTSLATYRRDNSIRLTLLPDSYGRSTADEAPWLVTIQMWHHNMEEATHEGIPWTTRNIVSAHSYVQSQTLLPAQCPGGGQFAPRKYLRYWKLREFPNYDDKWSRWTGKIYLYSNTEEVLSNFRLADLRRENIVQVTAENKDGYKTVSFAPPETDINCFDDQGKCRKDWFWPMQSVVPQESAVAWNNFASPWGARAIEWGLTLRDNGLASAMVSAVVVVVFQYLLFLLCA